MKGELTQANTAAATMINLPPISNSQQNSAALMTHSVCTTTLLAWDKGEKRMLSSTILLLSVAALGGAQEDWYERRLDDAFALRWRLANEEMEVVVWARTHGWVAVGLSPNGGMAGSDVMIGWVDEGRAHVKDASIGAFPPPVEDAQQDLTLVGGEKNATHTHLRWKRSLKTCDKEGDREFSSGTIRLIWAIGSSIPSDSALSEVGYHSARGGVSIVLIQQRSPEEQREQREAFERDHDVTWQFRMDSVPLGNEDTLYYCKLFRVPDNAEQGLQQIGARTVVDPPENKAHVHHLIVYPCDDSVTPESIGDDSEFDCYDPRFAHYFFVCRKEVFYIWAYGGQDEVYPSFLGADRGARFRDRYIMIEMHYDNPQKLPNVVDSSGVDLLLTTRKREYESGQFFLSPDVSWNMVVPPMQREFTISSECPASCTDTFLANGPIYVYAILGHTHLIGHKVRLHHIRDGKELKPIFSDEHYDFNLQEYREIYPAVQVLPGDRLIVECVYSTLLRTVRENVTFGGESTRREMCVAAIRYYPNVGMSNCGSQPDARAHLMTADLNDNEIAKVLSDSAEIAKIEGGRAHDADRPMEKAFEAVDWSDERKVKRLERSYKFGASRFFCLGQNVKTNEFKYHGGFDVFDAGYEKYEKSAEELACQHME